MLVSLWTTCHEAYKTKCSWMICISVWNVWTFHHHMWTPHSFQRCYFYSINLQCWLLLKWQWGGVIITFMHDLRRRCITRKTWLKFNHFLIYVFMQELTMDGHEWNNAMRLGLVWYPRTVKPLCKPCHIWVWRKIYCFRHLVPELDSSLNFSCLANVQYVYNSLQCITDGFYITL